MGPLSSSPGGEVFKGGGKAPLRGRVSRDPDTQRASRQMAWSRAGRRTGESAPHSAGGERLRERTQERTGSRDGGTTQLPAQEFFFDPEVLTEGQLAPNDRCCRICGKIGHFMKDCPIRRKSRQRREQEDRAEGRRDWAESEGGRERRQGDRWRRQEEKRCCFLCGSNAHIKKNCPQYRGPAGAKAENSSSPSMSHMRNFRERDGAPLNRRRRKGSNNKM